MTRSDSGEKVRGAIPFGADLEDPRMLWGALVPAPVAHGRIVRLDLTRARSMRGVAAAIAAPEVAALLPKGGGDPDRPVFPAPEIVYRNQPVAAVAAESRELARAAVQEVVCEAEPLPVVMDLDELFPEWPGPETARSPHVIGHVRAAHGDLAAAFRSAEFVHAETYRTAGVLQVPLEPHACLARVDDGVWRVATSTQTPFGIREDAASILGLPEEKLVIEGSWVGGGFGSKNSALLEPYALLLAAATGRPVKIVLSLREEFLLGRSTLPSVVRMETAVRGGRITARRVRLLLDSGASLPGRDFATGYAIGFLLGPYRVDTFEVEGYAVRTNKPPFGPHRAPFAPQCAFVAESHLDSLARRLGVDPVEFRLRYVWRAGDRTAYGQAVGPFGAARCLEKAQTLIHRWRAHLAEGHGIGVGIGHWATSTTAGGEARLRLGETELVIVQAEREIGSGSVVRGLVAVVERTLGVPAHAVRVETPSTDRAPFDSGVYGSRTVGALGFAVHRAAVALSKILAERTGEPGPIQVRSEGGRLYATAGAVRYPVAELLTPEERAAGGLVTEGKHYGPSGAIDESRVIDGTFYPYTDFTAAVHVAEVAVDRETGQVRPVRYAAFHDTGPVLDPAMVRAQVEGGVAMGLGEALTEETMWDGAGRLENPGLLDYRIPTLTEVPPIEVSTVEEFPGAGPFGAKGLGEPPIVPVPAAVANAFADATGSRVFELPLTPERVARALKLL